MFIPTPAGFTCDECGKTTDNKCRVCDDCKEE